MNLLAGFPSLYRVYASKKTFWPTQDGCRDTLTKIINTNVRSKPIRDIVWAAAFIGARSILVPMRMRRFFFVGWSESSSVGIL